MSPLRLAAALAFLPLAALAEPPKVVTDIPPVHSLVAAVMEGVGKPDLLLDGGGSPHGFALRPSQAAAMQDADLIVWIGPDLMPQLGRAIESSGTPERGMALLEVAETGLLGFREGPLFGDEHGDHGHVQHGHEGHAHGEKAHGDHAHGEERHGHEGHAHDHGGEDPHAWLDPENAEVWLTAIAARLSKMDPQNAATYRANAEKARALIDAAVSEAAAKLEPVRGATFFVYHDGLHYFEHRFRFEAAGAISVADAAEPGAARLAELRDFLREVGAVCIFAEPQFDPAVARNIAEGTRTKMGVLDPLGSGLEPGPGLYPAMIVAIAEGLADCLDHDH